MWRTNRVNLMHTKRFSPGWWRRMEKVRVLAKVTISTCLWPSLESSCKKRYRPKRVSLIGPLIIIQSFSKQTFRVRCLLHSKWDPTQPVHGITTPKCKAYKSLNLCQQFNASHPL
jgi:hypothetical protein